MSKLSKKLRIWTWLLALPLLPLGARYVLAQNKPAAPPATPATRSAAPVAHPAAQAVAPAAQVPAADSDYVGAVVCRICHEDHYTNLEDTPHWATRLNVRGGPSRQLCEGCHGPGRAHVEGGGDRKQIFIFEERPPEEVNARCLTCHVTGPNRLNAANSFHRQNQVSCIDCHSSHHAKTKDNLLIQKLPDLCLSCHLQQKSQFAMPFRHRVLEGLVLCTDCHNQHGTDEGWNSDHLVRQVRTSASGDYVCFKCHKDKQGPFVFEHVPVKVEGCATCHIPHGGANPHMLKYSNLDLQCLQCHTAAAFGHFYSGTAGQTPSTGFPVMTAQESTQQQACTLCHVTIHGSNFNSLFFR